MADEEIRSLVVLVEAKVDRLEKAMAKASATTTKRFNEMTTASGRAGKRMEADMASASSRVATIMSGFGKGLFLGAAGAIGVSALSEIPAALRKIVAEGAGLVDVAAKVGMTTDSLQELHFAATQGGASIEDMDKALGIFAKGLGEASQGSGELGKVLKANGVALRDQAGNIRPARDLLRDYADLLKHAGSEQERARLTAIAFGRAGGDLANVFRDGAAGIDDTASAAQRLGLVIDDEMLQKIADLDDRWDAFSTTLATRTKSAVLETVTWLDTLGGRIQALGSQIDHFRREQAGEVLSPGAMIGDLAGSPTDPMAAARSAASMQLQAALNDKRPSWSGRAEWLGVAKPTVLPPAGGSGGTRDRSADRAEREQQAIDRLVAGLQEENRLVGASDADRAVANNLRAAGASATEQQRAQIENLTRSLISNEQAYQQTQQAVADLKGTAGDVLGGLVADLRSGTDAATALGNAFDRIADRLIDMGLNLALDSVFKAVSGFGGGTGGLYAEGGYTGPGGKYEPAGIVHRGEYVINARETARHHALLSQINSGRLPGLAAGGIVGSAPLAPAGGRLAAGAVNAPTFNINAPVTVTGSAGTEAQNADLAARMARQMEATMRGIIADESRRSARPGNPLNNRGR